MESKDSVLPKTENFVEEKYRSEFLNSLRMKEKMFTFGKSKEMRLLMIFQVIMVLNFALFFAESIFFKDVSNPNARVSSFQQNIVSISGLFVSLISLSGFHQIYSGCVKNSIKRVLDGVKLLNGLYTFLFILSILGLVLSGFVLLTSFMTSLTNPYYNGGGRIIIYLLVLIIYIGLVVNTVFIYKVVRFFTVLYENLHPKDLEYKLETPNANKLIGFFIIGIASLVLVFLLLIYSLIALPESVRGAINFSTILLFYSLIFRFAYLFVLIRVSQAFTMTMKSQDVVNN